MIRITAFAWVPDFAQGLVRDLRARWALEEAGLPYEVHLLPQGQQATPEHRKRQPFAQIPVLEDGELVLFESGAIVLHVAEKSASLLPPDGPARERAKAWVWAALNSVETAVSQLTNVDLFHADAAWAPAYRPVAEAFAVSRLQKLSDWLGDRDYLEADGFTAGDLMMTTVLRIPRHTDLIDRWPNLAAYKARCEARPAFQKALADQLRSFEGNEPKAA